MFEEDPRVAVARRGLAISWTFYSVFLGAVLGMAAALGADPPILGLPRWVAVSCFVVPAVFVLILIPIVEKLIPDVDLSEEKE